LEWIEEFQRSLGPPVLQLVMQHWYILLLIGIVALALLFGGRAADGAPLFGSLERDRDSDSDGGGDGGD
jgi:hypothetical protein